MIRRRAISLISSFKSNHLLVIFSILLILLSFNYLVKGFYRLTFEDAKDLFSRWQEQQYIYQGQYPYYAREGSPNVIPSIGPIRSGGYLPWSFFNGFFFLPNISWSATRFYFAVLDLISLISMGIFAYQIGLPYGQNQALFSLAASLAICSNGSALALGQYGLIINALLIGVFWTIKFQKNNWSGLLFCLALVKPNISVWYLFILPVYRRFQVMIIILIYLVFSTLAIGLITQTNPLAMIGNILQQSKHFVSEGRSGVNYLLKLGIESTYASLVAGVVGVLTILFIFFVVRQYSLITLFAIASVIGRLAIYHRYYDNVMLFFFLLAVLRITFLRPSKLNYFLSLLLGLSLWLPTKFMILQGIYVDSLQYFIWLIALVNLLFQEHRTLQEDS